MNWLRRWFFNWWTAHQLRLLMQWGRCPVCRSSPPTTTCYVCQGSRDYAYSITPNLKIEWAGRYVDIREIEKKYYLQLGEE